MLIFKSLIFMSHKGKNLEKSVQHKKLKFQILKFTLNIRLNTFSAEGCRQ